MYGMIHKAIREMAAERFGEDEWRRVLEASGLSAEHFISAQSYPDDITERLLSAVGARAGIDRDALLEQIGRYWMRYAKSSGYASVIERTGTDIVSFLSNLDRMHASIKLVIRRAQLPSFEMLGADETEIRLLYRSSRSGYEPFAVGALKGLMDLFGEKGAVCWTAHESGAVFTIKRTAAAQPAQQLASAHG